LSKQQTSAVAAASKAALTSEERARIAHRQTSEAASRGEGPSLQKGKGRDPRDFGGISFEPGEDDPDLQIAMYQAYQDFASQKIEEAKKRAKIVTDRDVPIERNPVAFGDSERPILMNLEHPVAFERSDQVQNQKEPPVITGRADQLRSVTSIAPDNGMMPSNLMHPKSTIARSLRNGGNVANLLDDMGDESPSSSESSDTSDESSDPSESKGVQKKKKKKKKKSKRRVNVKPKEPSDYHGEVDFRKFNRFLKETRLYLKDAGFPKREYIMRIAPFLKGKALNFYTQKGELYETQWDLKMFYNQLFDFCFPPNYRMNLRDRLEKTIQLPDHPVTQYAHNIQEIFGMLGGVTQEDQVLKLWKGLKPEIQEGLWRDKLNPDHSSWDEILDQAVRIEMSLRAIGAKGYGKNSTTSNDNSTKKNTGGGGGNSKPSNSNKTGNFRKFKRTSSASITPSESSNTGQRTGSSKPTHNKGTENNPHSTNPGIQETVTRKLEESRTKIIEQTIRG